LAASLEGSMVRSRRVELPDNVVALHAGKRSRPPMSLAGLTVQETSEFLALDALAPFDDNGNIAWTFEGEATSTRERRWLELYQNHLRAAGDRGES
jgi:hypothetical protein